MALPSGYTEIPYLESTGGQYFDAEAWISSYNSIEIDAEITRTNRYQQLLGIQDDVNKFQYTIGTYNISGSDRFQFTLNTGHDIASSAIGPYTSGRHIWKTTYAYPSIVFSIDGTQVGSTLTPSGSQTGGNFSVYMFASKFITDSSIGAWEFVCAKVYEVTIKTSNDTLYRHYVPARRNYDSALGMYETVLGRFYTNKGTGSFITQTIDGPQSITVSSDITVGESVSVLWGASPASGVIGYELERSVDGGAFTQIYSGTGFYYEDTAESGWDNVQYRVRAVTSDDASPWVSSDVLPVKDPSAPVSPNFAAEYQAYLSGLTKPFRKLVRLEFLQPDDTVAFALGGVGQKFPIPGRDTRTFLQSGSVSVSLANGSRRRASVVLGNRDGAFDYAVNKLWFGQRVRLSMGMRLSNGEDFYFPMGVFYIENPSALFSPGEKTTTFNLTDKWAFLDGTLFGNLEAAYSVSSGTNIFSAIDSLLHMSRFTQNATTDRQAMVDPETAVYTTYFNGKTYLASNSDGSIVSDIAMTSAPYTITENRGSTMGALILKLNEMLAGWIGYDATGALRLEPSQDDIDDADKPVLFAFTPENSILLSHSFVSQNTAVYNDVTVAGQGLTNAAVWARAVNADPSSDTNINLIGRRVFVEEKSDYWNTDQCAALARWMLKRKTVLQKSVTIECGQMFHLIENRLISVKRTDKAGSPVEKHLIQGFTVPIGETGSMSITATSVTDIPDFTITTSTSS